MFHNNGSTMRDEWEFSYSARAIADAAVKKRDHHQGRLDWWTNKQKEVIEEIKSKGLEVSESIATEYALSAAARGAQLVVKNDYQQSLNECHQKIKQHAALVADYDGWYQILDANEEERLKLKQGDWLYFFGTK